jgi:2-hydroxychromene-2-carboxylate isomerase
MLTTADIDFWVTMGSTYSCLSAMRIPEVEQTTGVKIRWRPFSLRTILQEMKHIPFTDKPAKCAYIAVATAAQIGPASLFWLVEL